MGGIPDVKRDSPKPYLITRDEEGRVHLAVRETHYNTQGYPIIATNEVEQTFASATAARTHAKEHFGAKAGEFASK